MLTNRRPIHPFVIWAIDMSFNGLSPIARQLPVLSHNRKISDIVDDRYIEYLETLTIPIKSFTLDMKKDCSKDCSEDV
jgi:hypothetical protein